MKSHKHLLEIITIGGQIYIIIPFVPNIYPVVTLSNINGK